MAKITLDTVAGGFKSTARLIANFLLIGDHLNNKVLYRDNPDGETNTMNNDLDMNSNRITNLPSPQNDNDAARKVDILSSVETTDAVLPAISGSTLNQALSNDGASAWVFKDGEDLTFTQSDAGAAARQIGDKLNELVSPEDFGCVGDGSTDDTTNFAAALASTTNGAKTLHLLAGSTYKLTEMPVFNSHNIISESAVILLSGAIDQTVGSDVVVSGLVGRLTILGSAVTTKTVTAVTGAGSSGAWTMTLSCSNTSGIVVGDYIAYAATGGTGANEYPNGCWEVTAVNTNTSFEVLHTGDDASLPTFTSNGTISFCQTQLNFGTNAGINVIGGELVIGGLVLISTGGSSKDAITTTNTDIIVPQGFTIQANGWSSSAFLMVDGNYYSSGSTYSGDCYNTFNLTRCKGREGNLYSGGGDTPLDLDQSSFEINNGSVSGFSNRAALCTIGSTLECTGLQVVSSSASYGYQVSNNSFVNAGSTSKIDGPGIGLFLQSSSVGRVAGSTIQNCTTGIHSSEMSSAYAAGATMTANTTNYVVATWGRIIRSAGSTEEGEQSYLRLTDGASIPTTTSGDAFIYVDSADGDLKVKFGDGTVKTLATDT